MNIADLDTYGLRNAANDVPVKNPNSEWDASYAKRMGNDLAQLTRPALKAHFSFTTSGSNGARTASNVYTLWGNGASYAPTITRTGTGVYTIVWPASFSNELGETETLSFTKAHASLASSTIVGFAQLVGAGASWTLYGLTTGAVASDLTAGTQLDVWFY
jgi:hypothetical protein